MREHLLALAEAGMGYRTMAAEAGVSRGVVQQIRNGTIPEVSVRVRDRLFSVTLADRAPGTLIPAGPTNQLVGEMRAAGFSCATINRRIGNNSRTLRVGDRFVTQAKADAIAELAAEVLERRPVVETRAEPIECDAAPDPAWITLGVCKQEGVPTDVFFPEPGDPEGEAHALSYCDRCEVCDHCLTYGLTRDDGVWGGTTEGERKAMRHNARASWAS